MYTLNIKYILIIYKLRVFHDETHTTSIFAEQEVVTYILLPLNALYILYLIVIMTKMAVL